MPYIPWSDILYRNINKFSKKKKKVKGSDIAHHESNNKQYACALGELWSTSNDTVFWLTQFSYCLDDDKFC